MPRLNIDVAMRLAQFQDGLNKVERQLNGLGRNVKGTFGGVQNALRATFAYLGVRAVGSAFSEINTQLDQIAKSAEQVNLTTDSLQGLAYAASQNGITFEELTRSLNFLAKNMGDFQKGTGEAKDAIAALKLNVEKTPGVLKDTDVVLGELADKFAGFSNGANKTALAIKLFGESGAKLIPFLNKGSAGINELKQAAEDLGIIIDSKTIAASVRFKDNLETLDRAYQSAKINALGPLIQDLADITDAFTKAGTRALSFSEKISLAFSGSSVGKVALLRIEIQKLEQSLANTDKETPGFLTKLGFATRGSKQDIEFQLAERRKALGEAEKILEVQDKIFNDRRNEQDKKTNLPPAPALVNTQAAKAAADALLALQKARGEAEISEEERILADRLEVRKRFFDQGEILEEDYYATNLQIQLDTSKKVLAVLDEEVKARERAVASTKAGTADRYNAEKELLSAVQKRNEAERAVSKEVQKGYFEQTDAAKTYRDEIKRITAEVLALQGRTSEAVQLQTELEQADLRRRAAQRGDTNTLKLLDQKAAATLAEASFNKERERGQNILDALAVEEERIQNSRRVGAITDFEALTKTSAARKNTVLELQAISDKLKGIADESGLPKLTKQSAEFQVQLESLATETDLLADKFDSILQTGLGDLFSDLIDGSKSAKEAIQDFGKSVTKQINDLIAQNLSQKLFQSVLGGSGTSGGGFLSNLFSTGSLFGGGASATAGISAADLGIAFGGVFAQGGGFTVPGAGGQDSQLVAFKATPGEKVSVSTPQQSGGGSVINIHLNNPNFATGESISQAGTRLGTAINRQLARNS